MTPRAVRTWSRVHSWTSLVCTAFLLFLCLTGLPLIFKDEIDDWLDDSVAADVAPADAPHAALEALLSDARARHPGDAVRFMVFDREQPRVRVTVAPRIDAPATANHTLSYDAHTGRLLEAYGRRSTVMRTVLLLHREMLADLPGKLFLGAMGLVFVAAVVSGVVVYGPFMRRLAFGTVRRDANRRATWLDLHNLLGVVTLAWAVVVGATGALNTIAVPLFDLWRADVLPPLLAPYRGQPPATQLVSIDTVAATARATLPHRSLTSIVFPGVPFGSPRHFVVWTRGDSALTARLYTPVLIHPATGAVAAAPGLPWYLRALQLSRPLHFGDYGGLPLKLLWTALDLVTIAVLVSGLYLWWTRRRAAPTLDTERAEAAVS